MDCKRNALKRLEYRILDRDIFDCRQDAELTLGMFVNISRHSLGSRWAPEEIWIEHPRPDHWRDHERVFDAPVHFARTTNAVVFRAHDLVHRMPDARCPMPDARCPMPDARCRHPARAELSVALTSIPGGSGSVTLVDQVCTEIRSRLAATTAGSTRSAIR